MRPNPEVAALARPRLRGEAPSRQRQLNTTLTVGPPQEDEKVLSSKLATAADLPLLAQ